MPPTPTPTSLPSLKPNSANKEIAKERERRDQSYSPCARECVKAFVVYRLLFNYIYKGGRMRNSVSKEGAIESDQSCAICTRATHSIIDYRFETQLLRTNSNSTKNNRTGDPKNNERKKEEEPQNRKGKVEYFLLLMQISMYTIFLYIHVIRIYVYKQCSLVFRVCLQNILECQAKQKQ